MTQATFVAMAMFLGVVIYALFAGADFGSGFYDLTAGDARSGAKVRTLVDHSIGPVWEANHVWLIYILVIWWTGFPRTFAAATTTLFIPLALALTGIVLRGASFAFRKVFGDGVAGATVRCDLRGVVVDQPVLPGDCRGGDRLGTRPGRGLRRPHRIVAQSHVAGRRVSGRGDVCVSRGSVPHRRRRPLG